MEIERLELSDTNHDCDVFLVLMVSRRLEALLINTVDM